MEGAEASLTSASERVFDDVDERAVLDRLAQDGDISEFRQGLPASDHDERRMLTIGRSELALRGADHEIAVHDRHIIVRDHDIEP